MGVGACCRRCGLEFSRSFGPAAFPTQGDLTFSEKNANLLRPAAFGQSLLLAAVFRSVKRAYVSASRRVQAFRIEADAAFQQVSVFF